MSQFDEIILDLDVAHHKAALMAQSEAIRCRIEADPIMRVHAMQRAVRAARMAELALAGKDLAIQIKAGKS